MRSIAIWLALVVPACTTFQREDIVIDLRVLAMTAEPPDQVVDVDLQNPPAPLALLDQLVPTTVCALVADPTFDRKLRYSLTLCVLDSDFRCAAGPQVALVDGVLDDPDTTAPEPQLCATIAPDGNLAGVVLSALDGDVLHGLGGVDYGVQLRVGGEHDDPALDLYAGKTLRVSPRIPAARTANSNPSVVRFELDGVPETSLTRFRCADFGILPIELAPTQRLTITPLETDDARETYVVPTIDGRQETFTESLTYQWFAAAGSFSAATTGGPRDLLGNPPPLHSDYRAPAADQIDGVTDVRIWIVQRDERLGARWFESCVRVRP